MSYLFLFYSFSFFWIIMSLQLLTVENIETCFYKLMMTTPSLFFFLGVDISSSMTCMSISSWSSNPASRILQPSSEVPLLPSRKDSFCNQPCHTLSLKR